MKEWKQGDIVERRYIQKFGQDIWKRAFYNFTDEAGNHAITYPDGTKEMLSASTQDLR